MASTERYAVFRIAVASAALVLFLALIPRLGVWHAQGAFGILGLLGIGPLFFLKRKGRIVTDERDHLIQLRAIQIGMGVFWLLCTIGLWMTYMHFENSRQMPVDVLVLMAWLGWTAFELCHSVALLVLYRLI